MVAAKNSLFLIAFSLVSCSTSPVKSLVPQAKGAQRLWENKLSGFITDLSVSRDGSAILVSSAPNREVESGSRHYQVMRLDPATGKTLWSFQPESPVKAQSLADDGSLVAVATYNDRITAYDSAGKELWSADGTCKPFVLSPLKKIVCYHDDDAEAEIAFDVFDWSGKKLLSYPISNDVLQLKVGGDETHVAIALTRGQVVLFSPEFRSLWQQKVSGEILDLAVSPGPEPKVAVLSTAKRDRKLTVFDSKGKARWEAPIAVPAVQVEFAANPAHVVLYGNSTQGQMVAVYSGVGNRERALEATALRQEPWNPDANLPMQLTPELALISVGGGSVAAIDLQGQERWRVPVSREESVYLYVQSYSPATSSWVGATDDGWVTGYRIQPIR